MLATTGQLPRHRLTAHVRTMTMVMGGHRSWIRTDAQSWQRSARWRRRQRCRACLPSRPDIEQAPRPFYEKGQRPHPYTEVGSGFPLLSPRAGPDSDQQLAERRVQCDGGFKNDFRCITMDQRNAKRRRVHGPGPGRRPVGRLRRQPVGADGPPRHPPVLLHGLLHRRPVRSRADGRAPQRVVAAILSQPVGHRPQNPE